MKYLANYIVILFLVTFSACSDDFLEVKPTNSVPLDSVLSTPEDAQMFLNGAYDALREKGFMGGQAWLLSDMMADNINGEPFNGDWAAHYSWTTDIFLSTTRDLMFNGFKTVSRGNFLLDNIDNVVGLSEAEKNRMRGEVLFLRGLAHFELVRFFAQPYGYTADNSHLGIPIRTTYSRDIVNRSTVKEVYDQVISDLSEAANILPTSNNGYATSWAAKGYLAKVYFQMNDFQKAFDYANEVIQGSGASLETDLTKRFGEEHSNEAIFELIRDEQNKAGNDLRDFFRLDISTGVSAAHLSQSLYGAATADANDLRGQLWYTMLPNGLIQCTKFSIPNEINVPLVHFSEMKLIRAEAAAELQNDIAFQDIDDIRTRAGLNEVNSGTPYDQLIGIIRNERRLELMCEGNRLHDLKRQAVRNQPNLKIRGIAPWDCNGMVCQLPDNELKGNPDMEPNPTGGCQ